MEPTGWMLVALGTCFVVALLWLGRATRTEYKGSDPGRRFAANEVDRLLDRIGSRRAKPALLHPKRRIPL